MTKLAKSWMFFDASTIYLGACIPEIAENYQYLNLCAPSHGGYMVSSAGKCHHTKLPEFQDFSSVNFIYNILGFHFWIRGYCQSCNWLLKKDYKILEKSKEQK